MKNVLFLLIALPVAVSAASAPPPGTAAGTLPNILFILTDDLGYGDIGCYNPESDIPTPHVDQLAADGIRFTDAHSAATVCTPTPTRPASSII